MRRLDRLSQALYGGLWQGWIAGPTLAIPPGQAAAFQPGQQFQHLTGDSLAIGATRHQRVADSGREFDQGLQ